MTDRLIILLASLGMILHALAIALHWTGLGMRLPMAAVTMVTAATIIVIVLIAVRWQQSVFLVLLAGELLAMAAAAWVLLANSQAASWCLGIAASGHALMLIALLAFFALFRMSRLF